MKFNDSIVKRPFKVFIILAVIALLLPSLLIPFWVIRVERIRTDIKLISNNLHQNIVSGVEDVARMLMPFNSSATNLARVLSSSVDKDGFSFYSIKTKVAPMLFQALSTIPHLSQISYIGLDGLFFSFYYKGNQELYALYSKSSFPKPGNSTSADYYTWYTQHANGDTGALYGEAVITPPVTLVNSSWFEQALNSSNGVASLGSSWSDDAHDLLFINTARTDGRGAISLGFRVKSFVDIFSNVDLDGGRMYLATKEGKVLMDGIPNTRIALSGNSVSFKLLNSNGDREVGSITCQPNNGTLRASILKLWDTKYAFYCAPIDIIGVQSVYVMALPYDGLESGIHWNIKLAFWFLVLMAVMVVVSIFIFVVLIIRSARREMCLRAALIKQKEETREEERKSKNKSLAFATANHDIRASLAGITGLIEMCQEKVDPESEFGISLRQMETCTQDLLGILNSILDVSKIEAGKMQLDEEEFELGLLLEDAVDMFYTVGIKKGVDVVLDLDYKSFPKFSRVRGDRGKLKQILANLLSNAVKFTSEGYVSVRVWATKSTTDQKSILASARAKSIGWLLCFLFKNDHEDVESIKPVDHAVSNSVELVFEVDDTGKGIPKEKQKSIFENYVQVKETDAEHEGTGLGLGIVQSLVHLMGGDIQIVDKEVGERGTCFRFTARFTLCETDHRPSVASTVREDDIESTGGYGGGGYVSSDSYQLSGRSRSTRFFSPKQDASNVVLFIASDQRRKVCQKLIERQGAKVTVVKQWEQLSTSLKRLKHKRTMSWYSSSSKSDVTPTRSSSTRLKEVPLSSLDGTDQVPQRNKTSNQRAAGEMNFVLIVIDSNAGPFRELSRAVAEFRRESVTTYSRVVWLDKPGGQGLHYQGLDDDKLPGSDVIMTKPFHGSHLIGVMGFLPEFQDILRQTNDQAGPSGTKISTPRPTFRYSTSELEQLPGTLISTPRSTFRYSTSELEQLPGTKTSPPRSTFRYSISERDQLPETKTSPPRPKVSYSSSERGQLPETEPNNESKPLNGKRTLVAEDDRVQLKVTMSVLQKLGALVETCKNGVEAVELVSKGLNDRKQHGVSLILPYDYIFMDCQMPVMDGAEATVRIREEEGRYGVRAPIIGLTAHTDGDALDRMYKAGIDFHLSKPLKAQELQAALVPAAT